MLLANSFSVSADEKLDIAEFKGQFASYQKYVEKGQWKEALPYAKKSFELGRLLYGEDSKSTAALSYNYGLNLMELKDLELAKKVLPETLKIYKNIYGEEAEELIPVLMTLGRSMSEPFRVSSQKKYFDKALRLTKLHYGKDSIDFGQLNVRVGVNIMSQTLSRDARKYLYRGLEVLEAKLGVDPELIAYAAFHIGKYELSTKDYDDAVVFFNKALATFEKPDEPENSIELSTHGFLVNAYQNLEKEDQATKHCLAIGRMTPTVDNQNYQPIVKFSPVYPPSAGRKKQEGEVLLVYDVDESGFVINVKVDEEKSEKVFAEAALKSAEKYRYAPAFKDGKPVLTKNVKTRVIFKMAK